GISAAGVTRAELRAAAPTWRGVMLTAFDPGAPEDLALLRALRDGPPPREMSILALLPEATEAAIDAALRGGADDCIAAPLRPVELIGRVRSQLRLRAYTEELAREKQDTQMMLELTQSLAGSLDFHEILYTVVRRIAEVIRVGRVSIVLAPE